MKVSAFERHVVHRDAGSESVSERLGLEVRARLRDRCVSEDD